MAEIICLANSRKHGGCCIAGIEPSSGRWIRPVSSQPDGTLSPVTCLIEGRPPELLEVLRIPMSPIQPGYGFQVENRLVSSGPWQVIGTVSIEEVRRYCERTQFLFYNAEDRVALSVLQGLPLSERRSLQLIEVGEARFRKIRKSSGGLQTRVHFTYGRFPYDLPVTDPQAESKVPEERALVDQETPPLVPDNRGPHIEAIGRNVILTVSLGSPFERDACCYKLAAGVIEI